MAKNHDIRLRVSDVEKDRIRNIVRARGFATISDMVRDLCFRDSLTTEKKVTSIDERVGAMEKMVKSMYDMVKYIGYKPKSQYEGQTQYSPSYAH